jgi:hypothetical protein
MITERSVIEIGDNCDGVGVHDDQPASTLEVVWCAPAVNARLK